MRAEGGGGVVRGVLIGLRGLDGDGAQEHGLARLVGSGGLGLCGVGLGGLGLGGLGRWWGGAQREADVAHGVEERACVVEALVGLFGEELEEDVLGAVGELEVGSCDVRGEGFFVDVSFEGGGEAAGGEGWFAGEAVVEEGAEGVEVGALVDGAALRLLWGEVFGVSEEGVGVFLVCGLRVFDGDEVVVRPAGEGEGGARGGLGVLLEFLRGGAGEEDGAGVEVLMEDAGVVERREGLGESEGEEEGGAGVEWARVEEVCEGDRVGWCAPGDPAFVAVEAGVEVSGEVGVMDLRGGFEVSFEVAGLCGAGADVWVEEEEGGALSRARVGGLIERAEGVLMEEVLEEEARCEGVPGVGSGLMGVWCQGQPCVASSERSGPGFTTRITSERARARVTCVRREASGVVEGSLRGRREGPLASAS